MLDRETIIRLARDIATQCAHSGPSAWRHEYAMSRVMKLIDAAAAAEREACAKVADLVAREIDDTNGTATYIAAAIRARGEQR